MLEFRDTTVKGNNFFFPYIQYKYTKFLLYRGKTVFITEDNG